MISVTDPQRATVTLYRVDEARHATRLQIVSKPAWAELADGVQQSAGSKAPLCVLYSALNPDADFRHETWCYQLGSPAGYQLPLGGRPVAAVSSDGRTLLAVSQLADQTRELTVNRLHGHTTTTEHTVNLDDQRDGGCDVAAAAWAGGPTVTLECTGVDNDWPVWVEQDLEALTSGAIPGDGTELKPSGPLAKGYDAFSQMTPLDANTAVALLRVNLRCGELYDTVCPADTPKSKAVRVDLHTGRVLEIVAVAAAERTITSVSGGDHGIVYVTEGGNPSSKRVYVRWPGEKHGTRVVGLPAQFDAAVAQL
jgi:hypothetical protein